MGKVKVSMTIDVDVFKNFKEFCKKNGMKISTKVEIMMRQTIKDIPLNQFVK